MAYIIPACREERTLGELLLLGDVEVDDSGNFEISPSQTTTCNQQVNQAASASG